MIVFQLDSVQILPLKNESATALAQLCESAPKWIEAVLFQYRETPSGPIHSSVIQIFQGTGILGKYGRHTGGDTPKEYKRWLTDTLSQHALSKFTYNYRLAEALSLLPNCPVIPPKKKDFKRRWK